jgi:hypothetical protein
MTRIIVVAVFLLGWLWLAGLLVLLWPLHRTQGYWGCVFTLLILAAIIYDQWRGVVRRWGFQVQLFGSAAIAALGYWLANV